MSFILNKLVNYKDKEYAFIVGSESSEYCGMCVFSKECAKIPRKEIPFKDSPMELCSELCNNDNINFSFFVESKDINKWIK